MTNQIIDNNMFINTFNEVLKGLSDKEEIVIKKRT
jgi:hypothetical protein